jgi:hypothetical protein
MEQCCARTGYDVMVSYREGLSGEASGVSGEMLAMECSCKVADRGLHRMTPLAQGICKSIMITLPEPTRQEEACLLFLFTIGSSFSFSIFSLLSLFKKMQVGSVCVYVSRTPCTFLIAEPIFMKLGMYIMAPELISTTYFINPSHQSVCLYV